MRGTNRFRRNIARDGSMQDMFNELGELRAALDEAYMRFDNATEPELVEACVYEINAAQSRYNYQLRLIKESGGEAAFRAFSGREASSWA
ncbi:MAG: DUF2508 family protein [Oscillospiraceae bacterium]|nr:DUF2508 family protein [Oscillospiraceae bacterium]